MPILKVYSDGNELNRVILMSNDIIYLCENGIEALALPYLKDGKKIKKKVEEKPAPVAVLKGYPKFELKMIKDQRVNQPVWEEVFKFAGEDYKVILE